MSSKRSKVIAAAAAGTLAVAIAAGAAAATLPPGTAAGSATAADAYLTEVAGHQGATRAAQAGTMSGAQFAINAERARFGLQHSEDVAAAKAAAAHAAQTAQAAAKASAARAAAATAAEAATAKQAAAKEAAATQAASAEPSSQKVVTQQAAEPSGSPQQVAEQMLGRFGWSSGQFSCLEPLWERESGWDVTAENPSSGAYGIPQALSGSLMASSGPDWQTDAATQIRWGLTYIQGRYGSPCGAWAHEEADGWY
jgi:hypothetical protein